MNALQAQFQRDYFLGTFTSGAQADEALLELNKTQETPKGTQ